MWIRCPTHLLLLAGFASAASQLDSPVEVVEVGTAPTFREVVHAQKAQDKQMVLTPDSCFFFPTGPQLTDQQASGIPGAEFNRGNTYSGITNIRNRGQLVQWPVLPVNNGAWNIQVFIDTPHSGIELIVRLGDVEHTVTTTASDGETPQPWSLAAAVTGTGTTTAAIRWFELELVDLNGAPALGTVRKVRLSGSSMTDDYLLRARWRPAAIHGGFRSSSLDATGRGSDLFVMEQVADYSSPISLNFYSPVTTSFGYYGSVFDKVPGDPGGRFTASSPNFSMWNYGQGAEAPALERFAHLLALGHPDLIFGGFNHEGTGVKPRQGPKGGWPIQGTPLTSFVSALAQTPADSNEVQPFTRYTGSFWHPGEQRWRLYAVGNKPGVESFRLPSSFIEVPGPPTTQRTGHIIRRMLYRGWIRDTAGDWHLINSQSVGAGPGQVVNKVWDRTADGWLTREMGGIVHREYFQSGQVVTVNPPATAPAFMTAAALAGLEAAPPAVDLQRIVALPDGTLDVVFQLTGNPEPVEISLYHGNRDGLTLIFEDNNQPDEWDGPLLLGTFAAGPHTVNLSGNGLPATGYARLLAESAGLGRFWSHRTAQWFAPLEPATLGVGFPAGTGVAQVAIANPTNGRSTTYRIVNGNDDGLFALDPSTGALTLARDATSADLGNHPLTITATLDGWSGRLPALHVEAGIVSLPNAHVLALFDFAPDLTAPGKADTDGSLASSWTTSDLADHATGSGALGAGNQSSSNRALIATPLPHLRLSSNRESDAQTPLAAGGENESTWFTFSVTPDPGHVLDFAAGFLAIDTFANSTLGGTTSAHWKLYFRRDSEAHWTQLGTIQGAAVTGSGTAGPTPLAWNLVTIGSSPEPVHFLLDPQTAGFGTNGTVSQRGIGFGNLRLVAVCEAGPGFAAWAARHGLAGIAPESDDDHDQIPAAIEYALGLDPTRPDSTPAEFTGTTLTFHKNPEAVLAGVVYQIETSTDLGINDPWTAAVPDHEDTAKIRHAFPPGPGSRFARLRVILP